MIARVPVRAELPDLEVPPVYLGAKCQHRIVRGRVSPNTQLTKTKANFYGVEATSASSSGLASDWHSLL